MKAKIDYPHHLLMQWHLTERCNLRCRHCYQEDYNGAELTFEQLLGILTQYQDFLQEPTTQGRPAIRGHITVTGGEPFARRELMTLLELFAERRHLFSFALLTNGTFITKGVAAQLRELSPRFVQVSIEGDQETHDRIRGQGNFEQVVAAIRHLVKARVPTSISFTAHQGNFREFPQVAQLGRKLGVTRIWSDRLIPCGGGLDMNVLTPAETEEYIGLMAQSQRRLARWRRWHGVEVGMWRALQFLGSDKRPYHCTAGDTLITVQPNGDLLPCRRMPIVVGNLLEMPLRTLYQESELFQALRDQTRVSAGCQGCRHQSACRGGLKCLSYALTGDPFQADPGCWLATRTT